MGHLTFICGASWCWDCEVSEPADGKYKEGRKEGRIKSRIHGCGRLHLGKQDMEKIPNFFFRVGGREGGERMACKNTLSTREALGRCPKCGFSSEVSLLRPTHGTYCLSCCVEPHCTHPQPNHPFYPDSPPVRKTHQALFPFTASNKDGTIEHIFEGLTLRNKWKLCSCRSTTSVCQLVTNQAI